MSLGYIYLSIGPVCTPAACFGKLGEHEREYIGWFWDKFSLNWRFYLAKVRLRTACSVLSLNLHWCYVQLVAIKWINIFKAENSLNTVCSWYPALPIPLVLVLCGSIHLSNFRAGYLKTNLMYSFMSYIEWMLWRSSVLITAAITCPVCVLHGGSSSLSQPRPCYR